MHERVKSQSECTKAASKSDEPDLIFKGNTIVRVTILFIAQSPVGVFLVSL